MACIDEDGLKFCPKCEQKKSPSDFSKNKSKPDGLQVYCKPCAVANMSRWRSENVEHCRERDRICYAKNPNAAAARHKRWRAKNPDYYKNWEASHPGNSIERTMRWISRNMDRVLAYNAGRRAAIDRQSIPLTLEQKSQIISIYEEARRLSAETGIPHHVDHIVPINGDTVSGLHVPWNLRAIPARDNISKGNKLLDFA